MRAINPQTKAFMAIKRVHDRRGPLIEGSDEVLCESRQMDPMAEPLAKSLGIPVGDHYVVADLGRWGDERIILSIEILFGTAVEVTHKMVSGTFEVLPRYGFGIEPFLGFALPRALRAIISGPRDRRGSIDLGAIRQTFPLLTDFKRLNRFRVLRVGVS